MAKVIVPLSSSRMWMRAAVKECRRRALQTVRMYGDRPHTIHGEDTLRMARDLLALLDRLVD